MTQVNALFNKVANKGRFTLTEVEGYDVFTLCGIKTPAYSLFTNGNEAADFVSQESGFKSFWSLCSEGGVA